MDHGVMDAIGNCWYMKGRNTRLGPSSIQPANATNIGGGGFIVAYRYRTADGK